MRTILALTVSYVVRIIISVLAEYQTFSPSSLLSVV